MGHNYNYNNLVAVAALLVLAIVLFSIPQVEGNQRCYECSSATVGYLCHNTPPDEMYLKDCGATDGDGATAGGSVACLEIFTLFLDGKKETLRICSPAPTKAPPLCQLKNKGPDQNENEKQIMICTCFEEACNRDQFSVTIPRPFTLAMILGIIISLVIRTIVCIWIFFCYFPKAWTCLCPPKNPFH